MTIKITLAAADVELAYRALDDAQAEIEAFEKGADWYTPSGKMMQRIERAMKALREAHVTQRGPL